MSIFFKGENIFVNYKDFLLFSFLLFSFFWAEFKTILLAWYKFVNVSLELGAGETGSMYVQS